MPVRMTVSTSPPLREVLPLRGGLANELPRLAADMSRSIRDRTAAGRDVAGKPFRRKRDGSASNLTDTGKMVASFRPQQVTDTGFTLAPTGARNRKIGALAMRTGRRWAGADDRQIDEAVERIADAELPRDRNRP